MVPESVPDIHPRSSRLFTSTLAAALLVTALPMTALSATARPEAARPEAARPDDSAKRYALLIGNGYYQQKWTDLANPIPDVQALGAELRHRYDFLTEVLENPTRQEILTKLRQYYEFDYGSRGQLIVVFAGHGSYDEVTEIGFLVPTGSESRQRDPSFASLLSYPLLLALIDNLDCPNVLLIVDACFSGSLGSEATSRGGSTGQPRVRRFLTSGGIEYVPDGGPDSHTPFVRQLLAGLRSPSSGAALSLATVESKFMSRVEPKPRSGSFGSASGEGDFTLVVRGSAPPPLPKSASRGATASPSTNKTPAPPEATPPRLRRKPTTLSDSRLERAFVRLEIYDRTRNPEGNFPNEYRFQTQKGWDMVVDLEAGLMWQRAGSDRRMSAAEAAEYVAQLNTSAHAGFRDWRLPTLEELGSLVEPERQADGLFISPYFDTEQATCWTSDQNQESQPYLVSFNTGRAGPGFTTRPAFVRAVRSH